MDRAHRLTASRDFARALSSGRRVSEGAVSCAVYPRGDEGPARVGVVATKRVGGAVRRNATKRRLREAARAVLPDLLSGVDVVLTARDDFTGKDFHSIVADVRRAIEKAAARC